MAYPAELVESVGRNFARFTNITEITLPEKVTVIARYAFYGCQFLENVTFKGSITSLKRMRSIIVRFSKK